MNTELDGRTKGVDLKYILLQQVILHYDYGFLQKYYQKFYRAQLWVADSFHYSLQKWGFCSFGGQSEDNIKTQ